MTQQNTKDCGPAAVSLATGIPIGDVKAKWPGGWHDHEDWRDDINDWPDDHRLVLADLGFSTRTVTLTEILDRVAPEGKTIVLLHFGHIKKHWVVLAPRAPRTEYCFHWGNGQIRNLTRDELILAFTRSTPNCAYSISAGGKTERLPWYRRALGWFARLW